MIFPYVCDVCNGSKWAIVYDSEKKFNRLTCAGCQKKVILETIFGGRKIAEEIKKTNPQPAGSVIGDPAK